MSSPQGKNIIPLSLNVDSPTCANSETWTISPENNYAIEIRLQKDFGRTSHLYVKLTNLRYSSPSVKPTYLRAVCNGRFSESKILGEGWVGIEGPFDLQQNVILTLTCVSTFSKLDGFLLAAEVEGIRLLPPDFACEEFLQSKYLSDESIVGALNSVDPIGVTIEAGGSFLKLIRPDTLEVWQGILDTGVFCDLVRLSHLLPFRDVQTGWTVFPRAAVTESTWQPCTLLTFNQAKSLAKKIISVMKLLLERESQPLCLVDAHTGNFAQVGLGDFVLVDLGSVSLFDPDLAKGSLFDLIRSILAPLAVCAKSEGVQFAFARELLFFDGVEVNGELIYSHSSPSVVAQAIRVPNVGLLESVVQFSEYLTNLDGWIDSLNRPLTGDFWTNYEQAELEVRSVRQTLQSFNKSEFQENSLAERDKVIFELLSVLNHNSLIDLGCNTGKFSIYAALLGYQVLGLDTNETVVDSLFSFAKANSLPISANLGSATSDQFVNLSFEADVVLALAVTHHLLLGQFSPAAQEPEKLENVCRTIAKKTRKVALVEFMPLGMGSAVNQFVPSPNPLPIWYSEDNFRRSLAQFFASVEKIEYPGVVGRTRVLFFCEK